MKKFITIFFETNSVHLFKDVGMIPYTLAKYSLCKTYLAYANQTNLRNDFFEKEVKLINVTKSASKLKRSIDIIKFLYSLKNFDVVNLYHLKFESYIIAFILKCFNSNIEIYCKMDIDNLYYNAILDNSWVFNKIKQKIKFLIINNFIDICSIETKNFYEKLKNEKLFYKTKLIYLPNGIFISSPLEYVEKENIIMTCGRLGTRQKNTEMLVEAIIKIPQRKIKDWKVYFVGPCEKDFNKYLHDVIEKNTYLKNIFILVGNISDKKRLNEIYAKSKIFCLPSRWESFGLVVPEAMYYENYCIITDYAAAFDLTDNNTCGAIIQSENMDQLKKELEKCLDGRIDFIQNGRRAKELVENIFNWRKIVFDLMEKI